MPEIVEELEDKEMPCIGCKEEVTLKSYIIKDAKPYRYISYAECTHCGFRDTFEEDYHALDYGVKITCNFNKTNKEQNSRRMAYIHKSADVKFLSGETDQELFAFNCFRSHVDCIEGIWMRGKDILLTDSASSDRCYKQQIKDVEDCLESGDFKMIIIDESGYSKICPYGIEYEKLQDCSFEELNRNDIEVIHEMIIRKE